MKIENVSTQAYYVTIIIYISHYHTWTGWFELQ